MSKYPMVDQVNRLVGDLLAGGAGIFLPGVGAIYTERHRAQQLSRRSILPPSRVVTFSSQQRGVSLVDEIARAAQCDPAEAQDIYDRWLMRTRENETLTIEGVGVLKFKNFTPDATFDKRLNPQGHEPVRIKSARGSDWVLWLGAVAVVIAAGFGGYELWKYYASDEGPDRTPLAEIKAIETIADPQVPADTLIQADVTAMVPRPENIQLEEMPMRQEATANEPATLVSGQHYVVFGVYSTPENAARAAANMAAKDASLHIVIFRFGEKFMVSPFEAGAAEACVRFVRANRDKFPDLWTYTAR